MVNSPAPIRHQVSACTQRLGLDTQGTTMEAHCAQAVRCMIEHALVYDHGQSHDRPR